MKKIIGIIFGFVALFAIAALLMSSGGTTAVSSRTLSVPQAYTSFTPTSAQYLGGVLGKDTISWEIIANKVGPVTAVGGVDVLARKGTTDTYTFCLQGKQFPWESYADINKQTGKFADLVVADTLLASEREADNYYRYFKIYVATDNNCATTDSITFSGIYFKLNEW